jgi:UDP-glucose 4-epimerase
LCNKDSGLDSPLLKETSVTLRHADAPVMASITCFTKLLSVPCRSRSPIQSKQMNAITGFLNMLVAARDRCVKRFVYAGSCATYGDHCAVSQVEERIGRMSESQELTSAKLHASWVMNPPTQSEPD